jgi:hypothetical protein
VEVPSWTRYLGVELWAVSPVAREDGTVCDCPEEVKRVAAEVANKVLLMNSRLDIPMSVLPVFSRVGGIPLCEQTKVFGIVIHEQKICERA